MIANPDFEQVLPEIYSSEVTFTCSISKPSLNRTSKLLLTLYQVYTEYINLNMIFGI